MAAYAAVVSTIEILQQITQHEDPYSHHFPDEQQTEYLLEKFSSWLDILENQEVPASLEQRIRDAAYWAQDIIESHIMNLICLERQTQGPHTVRRDSLRMLFDVQNVMSFRRKSIDRSADALDKLHQDLQNVVQEVDSVSEVLKNIVSNQEVERLPSVGYPGSSGSRRTPPSGITSIMGCDEDLMVIKNQLCGGLSRLQVIPIVGMGGMGKTTLANNIFYDPYIVYHFDIRAWATITEKHKVQDILIDLMNSTSKVSENLCQVRDEVLKERLYKSLKGRRFLLVLDDIWSSKPWDEVKLLFPDDQTGSRIILTTRLVHVAHHANPSGRFHKMRFLNEDQSWNLLRDKVFEGERCPPEMEEVGRLIAKNCGGLPLSIILVAGVLSKMGMIKYQWENIARDVSSAVTMGYEKIISKIVSLSYNQLPRHLKPCFLYIGGFPEDYEIPVFKLITLWIAEGFLKPVGSKTVEEMAEEYLEDLVKRSLVIVTKRSLGKSRYCIIHDLVRDQCIRLSKDENFLHVVDGIQEIIEDKRRLSIPKYVEWFHFKFSDPVSSIAFTVFCFVYTEWVEDFCLLRVLDVLKVVLDGFPVKVLKLFHLRYLAFTTGFIRLCTLPPSMAEHQNLQTLIIGSTVIFEEKNPLTAAHLPIWKMPKLRHLVFLNITLSGLPYPIGIEEEYPPALENLQTLYRVRNFNFSRMAVDMIPNLKKLKAVYTAQASKNASKYSLHNLSYLLHLEILNLEFHQSGIETLRIEFGLPLQLKKLTLSGSGLPWNDMTVISSLPNLEVLKLVRWSMIGEEWETVEGEFPQLKFLVMESLQLRHWVAESDHFPRMEHLIIRECESLQCIPCEFGDIPTLEVVEVEGVMDSVAESATVIFQEQRSLGNDDVRLRVGREWK